MSKRANALEESMQAFRKLHRIVPKSPTVIYQIADLHERLGEVEQVRLHIVYLLSACSMCTHCTGGRVVEDRAELGSR